MFTIRSVGNVALSILFLESKGALENWMEAMSEFFSIEQQNAYMTWECIIVCVSNTVF